MKVRAALKAVRRVRYSKPTRVKTKQGSTRQAERQAKLSVGKSKPQSLHQKPRKRTALGTPSGLSPEQAAIAKTVVKTGLKMGATPKELLAAVETGLVESNLQNLPYGDADSLGWRQERASIYGTGPTGPTNVRASARRFFEESVTDGNRGAGMSAGQLAQAIQGSAFPERYDQNAGTAIRILRQMKAGAKVPPKGKRGKPANIVQIGRLAEKRFGLTTGENPAFGGVAPVHAQNSFHYSGNAIDVSGDPSQMMRFNRFVARKYGKSLSEMFYDPGVNIDNGQATTPIGGHSDHVHVAMVGSGNSPFLGPLPSGMVAPTGAGYGPGNDYNTTNASGQPPLAPRERLQLLRRRRAQRRQKAKDFMAGKYSTPTVESASDSTSSKEYSNSTAPRPVDLGL